MNEQSTHAVSRRAFCKATGAAGLALAANDVVGQPAHAQDAATAPSTETEAEEKVVWGHCSVNCYGRCALRLHVKNDEVTWIESDTTGDDEFGDHQLRACLRGRSMRQWINHPDRLNYPLKRVGKRGSGEFERISWDEAIDIIAENYRRVLDTYGPEAVTMAPATGVIAQNIRDFLMRFININGGFLTLSGGYSAAQTKDALTYVYGKRTGNLTSDLANSKLIVLFGDNFAENRTSGAGNTWHMINAIEQGGARVVVIDPRFTPSAATHADQWIPIRPGTDAALVDAMAYVMITEDLVDQDFLDTYCIGYDEDTLPEGAPAGASYKSYILGKGADGTPKTPAWAADITRVPQQTIVDLAREIATTKPCAVVQGLGPQRQINGEQTTRAICMLPILTGNVGVSGGGTGSICGAYTLSGVSVPTGENGVKAKIPTYMWPDAVKDGPALTKLNANVKGVDQLTQSIKFIWNHAGNSLTNQHGYINELHDILSDESLCEFIVTWETMLTDSAKYSDIVLPDLMAVEQPSIASGEYCGNMGYLIVGQPATSAKYERKTLYESLTLLAEKMGCKEEFTEGRDEAGWLEYLYNQAREEDEELPTYEEMLEQGVYRRTSDKKAVAFKSFREDPEANPLETDSGKIEIYSAKLADIAATWELPEGDVITPLHVYAPQACGYDDPLTAKYPLQMIGYHERGHVHSSYTQVELLQAANDHRFWINSKDAAERGIADGDLVRVYNDNGAVELRAKVTDRILRGVTALGEGMWFQADEEGVDVGSCINTLTSHHPSPLAKATPAHTNLVEVVKA